MSLKDGIMKFLGVSGPLDDGAAMKDARGITSLGDDGVVTKGVEGVVMKGDRGIILEDGPALKGDAGTIPLEDELGPKVEGKAVETGPRGTLIVSALRAIVFSLLDFLLPAASATAAGTGIVASGTFRCSC